MTRRAITLIELLIVITVIVILVGLIMAAAQQVRSQANRTLTRQRIEGIFQGLTRIGEGERSSVTAILQRDLPAIGGTVRFQRNDALVPPSVEPVPPAAWHQCFPEAAAVAPGHATIAATGDGAPLVMAHPWGRSRGYQIREAWYADPLGLANPLAASGWPGPLSAADATRWEAAEPHRLHELWPRLSDRLLVRAGIAGDIAQVRDDRSAKRPWNDAWGRPLVVAFALFQPPACARPDLDAQGRRTFARDHYLIQAHRVYGYNRSLFFSVGAIGPMVHPSFCPTGIPTGSATDADWSSFHANAWNQICTVTMPEGGLQWDETSFTRPPWDGIRWERRKVAGSAHECAISAPLELK